MAKQRTLFDGTDADRNPASHANMEQAVGGTSLGAEENPRFTSPVHVHFHHVRNRLCDVDNLCGKAVLDALVEARVLGGDTSKQVAKVTHSQSKGDQEKTIVTIETIKESKPGGAIPRR